MALCMRSEPENLRIRDDILRVTMMSLIVHELADVAHHGRCFQPGPIFRGQLMDRPQVAKELQGVLAYGSLAADRRRSVCRCNTPASDLVRTADEP